MEWLVVLVLVGLVAWPSSRRGATRSVRSSSGAPSSSRSRSWPSRTSPRSAPTCRTSTPSWPGSELDAGARADYQRALDAYEAAKTAADRLSEPDDVQHVTEILEDGRYAIACVRARVAGEPLPTRRPPCFFDPRHGLSVTDVEWTPPGGAPRESRPAPWTPSGSPPAPSRTSGR